MAELGGYTPGFLAAWAMYQKAWKKIEIATVDYGCSDRDVFMASSPGSKTLAYKAWQTRLQDTYCGAGVTETDLTLAIHNLLLERLKIVKTQRKANLGHLSSELNKEAFNDYIEAACEEAIANQAEPPCN